MSYVAKTFKWGADISSKLEERARAKRKKQVVFVLEALAAYDPELKETIYKSREWTENDQVKEG